MVSSAERSIFRSNAGYLPMGILVPNLVGLYFALARGSRPGLASPDGHESIPVSL